MALDRLPVRYMPLMTCLLPTPPYIRVGAVGPGPLPLESALLVDIASGVQTVYACRQVHEMSPWRSVVAIVPGEILSTELLAEVHRLPAQTHFVARTQCPRTPASLGTLIRRTLPPDAAQIAGYVAARCGSDELGSLVAHALRVQGPSSPTLRSRMSRQMAAFGPLTPRDWRAVCRLLHLLHAFDPVEGSVDRYAGRYSVDPRTPRQWARKYLGSTIRNAGRFPGWRWRMERVLQRFDYLKPS